METPVPDLLDFLDRLPILGNLPGRPLSSLDYIIQLPGRTGLSGGISSNDSFEKALRYLSYEFDFLAMPESPPSLLGLIFRISSSPYAGPDYLIASP